MAPIKTKRRNDSNLIICGTPADKLPKPPDPSDNLLKPSLWKALEAVVAAGKRGLLGPAAAAPPVLNVGGSNGMFCQEAQNPIPLVTERRERKKPVIQKRSALVTVVRHVESKQSRANANMLRPQTQVNAPKQNPSLFPFFKPLHSSCMSAGKLSAGIGKLQSTPKEIWICGNSVILSSKQRARVSPHGLQLSIPTSSSYVYWHGVQAMMWDQLVPLLHEIYHHRSSPSVLFIHLGENDLLPDDNISLIIKMKNDLGILSRAFPNTIIIWSSLLPRHFCKEAENAVLMAEAQKHVNRNMADYCHESGMHFLSHNLITSDKPSLFLPDKNELSDAGADIFMADLKTVLEFCLGIIERRSYQPAPLRRIVF